MHQLNNIHGVLFALSLTFQMNLQQAEIFYIQLSFINIYFQYLHDTNMLKLIR